MELQSIFRSFQYDRPRAEFCCRLGYYFMNRKQYDAAVFWYHLATELQVPTHNWGFSNPKFSTWLPHLQLCVCYDQLGQHAEAYKHNEIARSFRPKDRNILHNKKYLESVLQITGTTDSAE
ncbi:Tetratricopeptide repeat protein [compost metagenome]